MKINSRRFGFHEVGPVWDHLPSTPCERRYRSDVLQVRGLRQGDHRGDAYGGDRWLLPMQELIRNFIQAGVTGLLYEVGNPKDLCRHRSGGFYENPTLAKRIGLKTEQKLGRRVYLIKSDSRTRSFHFSKRLSMRTEPHLPNEHIWPTRRLTMRTIRSIATGVVGKHFPVLEDWTVSKFGKTMRNIALSIFITAS